jgi:LacI family transcriptional regulator
MARRPLPNTDVTSRYTPVVELLQAGSTTCGIRMQSTAMRTVTLQDVADRARVHRSTVALALRDHPRIPAETRQRIRALAEKLGYRLNPLVAALMKSRRSGDAVKHVSLAFVTNYPTRDGWRPEHHDRPDFFPGAIARARDFGYRLDPFWLAEPGMTPARFCDILTARGIHGIIIGRLPPGQHAIELLWERFSCVALGMTLRSPRLHHVTENHFDTAMQAMQQCLDRGYQRVGFAFTDANDSPRVGDRWVGAYLLQQQKVRARDRLPLCPGSPATSEQFAAWFERHRPDALLVNHAPPVVAWLRGLGLAVPRDVGLVELEDHPDAGSSGVYYDPAKIGALAVDMLVGLMHRNEKGVPADQHEILLSGEWREGTTLPPRGLRGANG